MNNKPIPFFLVFILCAFAMETTLLADGEKKADPATVGFQANWPVSVGTMGKTARVYIRSKGEFTGTPEFLQGLQYTRGFQKRVTTISCRVKTPGRIYLCLFGEKTPQNLGLPQKWEKAGSMRGPSFQGKEQWTVYQTDAKKGDILTFLRDDPMGVTVVAGKITKDKNRPLPKIPKTKNAKRQTPPCR